MDILDEIKSNLATNENLTEEIKADMFNLIVIFHQTFPDISLEKLDSRIKDVKLGKIGVFERKGPIVYDAVKNEIALSNKKLKGEYDANHLMMKGILGMISSADTFYGFNTNNRLRALNIGYTEMLANFLVGNEGICDYEEELLAADLASQIISPEEMFSAYFNNSGETVYKKMLEAEDAVNVKETRTQRIIDDANYFLTLKESGGQFCDMYSEILKNYSDIFGEQVKKGLKSEDDIDHFQATLPGNDETLDNKHVGLNVLPSYFNQIMEVQKIEMDVLQSEGHAKVA